MGARRIIGAVVCALAIATGATGTSVADPLVPVGEIPTDAACLVDDVEPAAAKAESCRSITFGVAVKDGKWEVMVRDNIGDIGVAPGSTIAPNVPGKPNYTITVVLTDPDPAKQTCVFDGIYVPGGTGVGTPEVTWTLVNGKYQLTIKLDGKLIDPGQGGKQEGYRIFARCK